MARPIRIHHPGLIYHVINRGNNRQAIFLEEEDYEKYLGIIYRYKKKYGFKLYSYCLMNNHIHLLIQVNNKATISKIMQCITVAHTRHYHFKYETGGHVWQGRFSSPIVSDDVYMLRVMQYIEQNPLRAKIVREIGAYKWSSYKLQVRRKDSKLIDRKDNHVFTDLGQNVEEQIRIYKQAMKEGIEQWSVTQIKKSMKGNTHFISEKFQKKMQDMLPQKKKVGRPRKQLICK